MITLSNIETASMSDVFHQAAIHLLTQFEKSLFNNGNGCAYRGSNNMKCAAGVFLEDKDFSESFEGKKWEDVVERCGGNRNHENHNLIRLLQRVHDDYFPREWSNQLQRLAFAQGITLSDELKALVAKREAEMA